VRDAFLNLLAAALGNAHDPVPELTADQWRELFAMAAEHKVLPLIFEPAYPQVARLDPALAADTKRQVRLQVVAQTIRTAEFLELYRALEEAGATPLVVKGIVCRQLYPRADHRPSADEDLWIPPEQYPLCHGVMTRLGLVTGETDANGVYEVPYRRAGSSLYIELHKHLFPPGFRVADAEFNGFFSHARHVIEQIPGGSLRTLHPTDHMTYLLFHAFKHFLHSGFGIRQICDILLFAHRHGGAIDWERVRLSCRAIRAEKFAAALFAIGTRHLGFGPVGPWGSLYVDEKPLLQDVLCAGVYGSADLSRQHSSTITLEAVSTRKKAPAGILAAAFPTAKHLEGRYPWLKKQPWLLPVAWTSRMADYLRETKRRPDSSLADALKIGTERVELLKRYDIL
jgi:hypothetical protein